MDTTQEIIDWLNSDEGLSWAYVRFEDATECHDIIEIHDDYPQDDEGNDTDGWWSDSTTKAAAIQFRWLRRFAREWRDLRWTPDVPPEGGVPCGYRMTTGRRSA